MNLLGARPGCLKGNIYKHAIEKSGKQKLVVQQAKTTQKRRNHFKAIKVVVHE